VVVTQAVWDRVAAKLTPRSDVHPEGIYERLPLLEVDPREPFMVDSEERLITVKDGVALPAIMAFRLLASRLQRMELRNPILLKDLLEFAAPPLPPKIALLRASVVFGSLLADGIGDAILIRGESGAGQSSAGL